MAASAHTAALQLRTRTPSSTLTRKQRALAAASADVPMTASEAADAANAHVERRRLLAPGIGLYSPKPGKREVWRPDMRRPPPPHIWAQSKFRVAKKQAEVTLGGGPPGQIIAAANRVASRCNAARLARQAEGQELIDAVQKGEFGALIKKRFQHALAAVQAQAAGAAAQL